MHEVQDVYAYDLVYNLISAAVIIVGWFMLIVGSLWLLSEATYLNKLEKNLLTYELIAFFTLGITTTLNWMGYTYFTMFLSAVIFIMVFIMTFRDIQGAAKKVKRKSS